MLKNLMEAFDVLENLEKVTGRNEKCTIITKNKDNCYLKKIFYYTYSGIKFHTHLKDLKNNPQVTQLKEAERFQTFISVLDSLANREITGNAAIALVDDFFSTLTTLESKWYARIMNHDLRIGITKVTLTKIYGRDFWDNNTSDNTYSYREVMLSDKWEKKKSKFKGKSLYIEPKYDGYRLAAIIEKGDVTFYSRGGKSEPYTENLTHIAEQLLDLGIDNCMVDGEVIKDSWNGTGIVKKLKSSMTEEDVENLLKVKYLCFDYIDLENIKEEKVYKTTFKDRRNKLEALFEGKIFTNIKLTDSILVSTEEEILNKHAENRKAGHEGSMVKNPEGFYEFDKRSINWLKIKPVHTIDGKIIGFEPGTGKNSNRLGALKVIDSKGAIYNCGQGISDEERESIWAQREQLLHSIVEMEAQDETNTTAVATARNAVFLKIRGDRDKKL